ncbi:hypothetical protein ACFLZT_08015 [Thermodesulfobacteriota bacterium]
MKRTVLQIILIVFLVIIGISGYILADRIYQLPFRETNDALHNEGSSFNLDFLIPSGTHIDEKMTVGEVLKIRTEKQASLYERVVRSLTGVIPVNFRYLFNLSLFLFWSFLFMTFFRIFTFMGYGRALRVSLFLGACTYLFMPDFFPVIYDDILLLVVILLLIVLRSYILYKRKKRNKFRQ